MGHLGRHCAFYGMTSMGKTTLAQRFIAGQRRVLALDVNDEWSQWGRRVGPLRERCTASELSKHGPKLLETPLSLSVVPDKPTAAARARTLKLIWSQLEACATHRKAAPLVLVLDELGEYAEEGRAEARSLATRGLTHLNVSLIVLAQRPYLVPKTVRSQMSELFIFRLEEVDDADAATERCKPDAAQASATVQALPPHKHFHWRPSVSTTVAQPQQQAEA